MTGRCTNSGKDNNEELVIVFDWVYGVAFCVEIVEDSVVNVLLAGDVVMEQLLSPRERRVECFNLILTPLRYAQFCLYWC